MEIFRTDDWKKEKHVPVIEVLEKKEDLVTVRVSVGKEIKHPNTVEHHIRFIELYFLPEGESFAIDIGRAEFNSHGESAKPNTSTVFTEPVAIFSFRTGKKGRLIAFSYCNIHGLWRGEEPLQ